MANKELKWTQWDPDFGMTRCGIADYRTLMEWMRDLGMDAKACVQKSEKPHAFYGRAMHDAAGNLTEIRFYANTYMTDEELDETARHLSNDTLYVAHR